VSALTFLLPLGHAIPAAMKEYVQFVAVKMVERGGKATKIPINPDMGSHARVDTPSTWGTFAMAMARYRKDRLAGIGFVFTPHDPFTGIDFDKCRDPATGEIDPEVRAMIGLLDSYSEFSMSGTGVHTIVRASLIGDRNRVGRIEMYDKLRFFATTGHRVPNTPVTINERQPQLATLYRRIFGESVQGQPGPIAATAATLSGDALWQWAYPRLTARMMRIANLDDTAYGDDASRADAALCAALMGLGLTRWEVAGAFRSSPRGAALAERKGGERVEYLIARATNNAAAFVGEGKIL